MLLAIRVDSESGATEFLVANPGEQPQWIAVTAVEGAYRSKA